MRVHHVAIQVRDLERARAFYVDVLGLVEVRRQPHSIWVDADGALIMLEACTNGGAAPPWQSGQAGLHLLALAIHAHERPAWRAKLATAGAPLEGQTPFTLYTRDPDGTRIGLSSYPEPADP
jgi:catechol 2,3-dioxygenase-like lactoylglutathione lyase family enzyme